MVSCSRRVMVPSCWNTSGETARESAFMAAMSSIFMMWLPWSGRGRQFLHDLLDLLFQRRLGERLDDVARGARLRGQDDVFLARLGRHHQHGQVLEGVVGLDRLEQVE